MPSSSDKARTQIERWSARCAALEATNQRLTSLWVASTRLHSSLDLAETLDNIRDIVVTLIGSEEIAIWNLDGDGNNLVLQSSEGIDATRWAKVPARRGVFNRVVSHGEIYIRDDQSGKAARSRGPKDISACVPLRAGGLCTGAVGIFSLLSHKRGLNALDRALLDLIASQAATVLICASRSVAASGRWGRRDG